MTATHFGERDRLSRGRRKKERDRFRESARLSRNIDDRGSSQSSVRHSSVVFGTRVPSFPTRYSAFEGPARGEKSDESRGRAVHDPPDDQVDEIQPSDLRRQRFVARAEEINQLRYLREI